MEIRKHGQQVPFTTKDGSTIRSLLDLSNAPVVNQSLAEATRRRRAARSPGQPSTPARVAQQLRDQITQGRFQPGARLREEALAAGAATMVAANGAPSIWRMVGCAPMMWGAPSKDVAQRSADSATKRRGMGRRWW